MFKTRPRCKADTPLKAPLTRRHVRGRLSCKKYDAVPEHDPEGHTVEGSGNVRTSSRPSQCKSQFQPTSTNSIWPISSSSAASERFGHVTLGHPGFQMRPGPLQTGLTVTPVENSRESSDHDDIWDSSTSSSVLSLEMFRDDSYTSTFDCSAAIASPVDVQQPPVKNSTLLGSSHAESIHRHQPPNVSTVLDATSILVNTNGQIRDQGATTEDPPTHSVIRSADESLNGKSMKSAVPRRPISYRKVLRFKTPLEKQDSEGVGKVMFFHFDSCSNRKEFFRRARERHARLAGCCLFVQPSVP